MRHNTDIKNLKNTLSLECVAYPQFSGRRSFWQLNHESPVSAITAVSPLSIAYKYTSFSF